MRIIGIDPGKQGALAFFSDGDCSSFKTMPMPLVGKEIDLAKAAGWMMLLMPQLVCIENVHPMPGEGVKSVFSFGFSTGAMHGISAAAGFPLRLVTPQAWKKVVLAGTKRDKDAALAYVRRAYPNVNLLATDRSRKPHQGIVDAICIAEYAWRTFGRREKEEKIEISTVGGS